MRNYDLKNPVHMVRCIAREKYTFPGGYELCGIMDDGALLCSDCIKNNYREVIESTKKNIPYGWEIIGITNESELEQDSCSHCYKRLGYWEDSGIYSEEVHAQRLVEMLKKDIPCLCCPAAPDFDGYSSPAALWDTENGVYPCYVCRDFLDCKYNCPCAELGRERTIKLTQKKLKEKGYIC